MAGPSFISNTGGIGWKAIKLLRRHSVRLCETNHSALFSWKARYCIIGPFYLFCFWCLQVCLGNFSSLPHGIKFTFLQSNKDKTKNLVLLPEAEDVRKHQTLKAVVKHWVGNAAAVLYSRIYNTCSHRKQQSSASREHPDFSRKPRNHSKEADWKDPLMSKHIQGF